MMAQTLLCSLCKQEKPDRAFYRSKNHHRRNRSSECIPCAKIEQRWRERGGWDGFWKRMSAKGEGGKV